MRMVWSSYRQPSGGPRSVTTDEVGDVGEAQANQVGRGQGGAVAAVADKYQWLVERPHRRMQIPVCRIEVPLDNSAWHVDSAGDDTEALAVGVRTSVENQCSVGRLHPRCERVG